MISVNVYRESLDGFHLTTSDDKPILVGEFSFWAWTAAFSTRAASTPKAG